MRARLASPAANVAGTEGVPWLNLRNIFLQSGRKSIRFLARKIRKASGNIG